MPDISGWSESEVINFCNLVNLKYSFNNYGYVENSNIPAGTVLDTLNMTLEVNFQNINPNTYSKKKEEEKNE